MRRYNVHVCLYNPGATWPCSIPSDEHFSGPTVHSQACDIHLKPSDLPGRPIGEYWCSPLCLCFLRPALCPLGGNECEVLSEGRGSDWGDAESLVVKVKGSGGVYGPERVILDFVIMSRCLFNKAMGTRSLDCCPEPSGGRDIVAGHGGLWGGATKRLLRLGRRRSGWLRWLWPWLTGREEHNG